VYDFSTGKSYAGGSSSTVPAPLERMPLFVRAGSIVPMGPVTLGA
jgi:alpha-D-xyloside xylohydrolase